MAQRREGEHVVEARSPKRERHAGERRQAGGRARRRLVADHLLEPAGLAQDVPRGDPAGVGRPRREQHERVMRETLADRLDRRQRDERIAEEADAEDEDRAGARARVGHRDRF